MPGGDGTGPFGRGPIGGESGRRPRGRMGGNRAGAGPVGDCVCPKCGEKVSHRAGVPCYSVICQKCGSKMIRE